MKKKKEKFRQPKQKKHRNHHLRFMTKLILLLLLVTVGMGLYYSYQLFFIPVHQEVKSEDKGLTKEQKEVKQEREELEKQGQENKTSIDYIADGSQEKDESVGKISDESDALNALKALQGELGIADVQEEYRVSKVKELEDLTVYEMQQYYEGIEVYGRSLMVSVDESGNLQSVNGTYEQPSNVAVEPEIQEYDAQEAAEAYLKENKDKIDELINKYAKNWSVNRMPKVDLSILRLAICELVFIEEIPSKVSINEAIELAKLYCDDKAPKFINGILGSVVNEFETK